MNMPWIDALHNLQQKGEACILVTVLGLRGSAPSETGTKMVVTVAATYATIGGGDLEYKATEISRNMLREAVKESRIECFPLGSCLSQCCGGSVFLLFEPIYVCELTIALFGAGHVAKALAKIFSELPCRLHWIDSRENQFPEEAAANMILTVSRDPSSLVSSFPENSYYIVMTHNHQIDFEICEAILKGGGFRYLGLIGSDTKWLRFKQRLRDKGCPENKLSLMRCPMGMLTKTSKRPMEIAVSIAAEIIDLHHQNDQPRKTCQGIDWHDLRKLNQQFE